MGAAPPGLARILGRLPSADALGLHQFRPFGARTTCKNRTEDTRETEAR
jgi:hypothetical protein